MPSKSRPRTVAVSRSAYLAVFLAFFAILPAGCERKGTASKPKRQRPVVYTTFYPTTYFAQRIAGDYAEIVCPCPATEDPIYWMPDDKTLAAYQQADLIVINGASFEKWLDKASLPQSRIVDTSKSMADSLTTFTQVIQHTHGPRGEHAHAGIDGHLWLDPLNSKAQAQAITTAFIRRDPDHTAAFQDGFTALAKDLDDLDARLRAISTRPEKVTLLCSHPAYNYIARRYGWQIRSLHLDPQAMPDAKALAEIKQASIDLPAQYLLWEVAPADGIADTIRQATGVRSIVFSPCETLADDALQRGDDYLSVMRANIAALEQALMP